MNRKTLGGFALLVGVALVAGAAYLHYRPGDLTPNLGPSPNAAADGSWKRSGELILAEDDVWSRKSPAAARYDDGVALVGAVTSNPNDTPVSASRNSEVRAGLLQAVIFVDRSDASLRLQDDVHRILPPSGWTVGTEGMIAFCDSETHSDLMQWLWVRRGSPGPIVVICRDGQPLAKATGFTSAQQLAGWLNQQTLKYRVGFR